MSAPHAAQLIDGYLRRLELELEGLPAQKRGEIVDEIRGHIADQRRAITNESDSDLLNILDRLGEPAEIAAEARGGVEKPPVTRRSRDFGTHEVLALALTILAWPVGVIMLWTSNAWTTREKLLGMLVPPGGYPGVFLIMATFRFFAGVTDAGPAWVTITVGAVLFTISLLLVLSPIGMCVYLATRLGVPMHADQGLAFAGPSKSAS